MTDLNFIKSVKNNIPNPPFLINIITDTETSNIDDSNFKSLSTANFADSYYWTDNQNIKYFDINLNSEELGIQGIAQIAILETKGMPKKEIIFEPNTVNIEGENYSLKRRIWMRENRIDEESTSITVDDQNGIDTHNSTSILSKSKSKISLHGIEIPCNLFPDSWNKKENQATINFPFPLTLIVDIFGRRDLDLNSSRTDIILTEKWMDFEEKLALLICEEIFNKTQNKYWNKFKKICVELTNNEIFKRAILTIPDK
ncbi:hypothetical protein D3C87_1317870 [compost metagenome]